MMEKIRRTFALSAQGARDFLKACLSCVLSNLALMLPVGGTYTIDAAAAAELVRRLHPRLVLPMHFRRGEQGFPELTTLEDFLSRLPEQPVHRLTGETLDLTSKGMSGVVIFPRR